MPGGTGAARATVDDQAVPAATRTPAPSPGPVRRRAARGRPRALPGRGPRDERVRVPHLARSGRATAPRERRGATHGAQEPPDRGGVARDDDGRPDGVLPVGDRSVRPAAHLVPEPAERPSGRRPTGPVTTTPRSTGGPPHAGVISTTYGTPSHRSPSAAWNSGRGRRRARSAAARSHAALVRRTTWPPAPTGSQRSSARSPPGVVAVTPRRYGTRTRTGPVGSGHASGVRAPAGSE